MMERMTGHVQPYAWGSTTMIPELLGEKPTGEPQAELWLGAHPSAPARVGDRSLDDLVTEEPDATVGAASVAAFGPRLPYLLKVLAAAQPLSLQAHPSRAQAEAGFARENEAGLALDAKERLYRDDWPKPEVLCALVDSEALCGFAEPAETYGHFERLGVARALALVAPLAKEATPAPERLAAVFGALLRLSGDELEVVDQVVKAAQEVDEEGPYGRFAETARDLSSFYPGDPGVLAALCMNRLSLRPNDAVYLPAGNLHAYLRGGGVEIMANSDNVLRGGLTPKHVDVDELLSVLDFSPGFAGLVVPIEVTPGAWRYPTPALEFALWRLEPSATEIPLPGSGTGRVVIVTDGSVSLRGAGTELALGRGQAAFVSAYEEAVVYGSGTLFVGGPGTAEV
ncbi:MAG: manA [Friedmanniella sp.]|nr:manA [Friedmanniella sp.]